MARQKAGVFSQRAYDESDQYAKDILINFVNKRGHTVLNSNENMYFDITTSKDGVVYRFEVETKQGRPFTTRDTFKFPTVSFLGRKKRLHDIEPFYYVIICPETEWALSADSVDIFQERYVEEVNVDSRDRAGKDLMYRIPREKCVFFNTNK
jgi:hypothetical protein